MMSTCVCVVFLTLCVTTAHGGTSTARGSNSGGVGVGVDVGVGKGVGVWVDDGYGRTVQAGSLSPEEAVTLAQDILDVFSLPDLPPPSYHYCNHTDHHAHGSAHTWLKHVYDTLDDQGHAHSAYLDPAHRLTVSAADTIITFASKDRPVKAQHYHQRPDNLMYFDVSDVPLDHWLLEAEVHVHYQPGHQRNVILHVYVLTHGHRSSEKEVARMTLSKPGWNTINITTTVRLWLALPEVNYGLRLALSSSKQDGMMRSLDEAVVSGVTSHDDYRPFLVGYFTTSPSSSKRKKRKTRTSRSIIIPSRSSPRSYPEVASQHRGGGWVPEGQCRKRHLHVSFRELGWQHWIIAPEGYDANYCHGHCEFPDVFHDNLITTTHALLQTLINVLDAVEEDQVLPPHASCAPQHLTTMPILYYSYENNVRLKKYPKMVVKTCGCH